MFSIIHGAAKFEYGGKSDLAAPDPPPNGKILAYEKYFCYQEKKHNKEKKKRK